METEGVHAVGKMMITTKEHVVRLRPADGLLAVDLLEYASGVRTPEFFKSEFEDDLVDTQPTAQETKLTRQLVSSLSEDTIDLGRFTDTYTAQVKELIDAKIAGKELVSAVAAEPPPVVNLMDALRESMARSAKTPRPAKRKSPSETKRTAPAAKTAAKRKKSG